jgi:hypothetical protein
MLGEIRCNCRIDNAKWRANGEMSKTFLDEFFSSDADIYYLLKYHATIPQVARSDQQVMSDLMDCWIRTVLGFGAGQFALAGSYVTVVAKPFFMLRDPSDLELRYDSKTKGKDYASPRRIDGVAIPTRAVRRTLPDEITDLCAELDTIPIPECKDMVSGDFLIGLAEAGSCEPPIDISRFQSPNMFNPLRMMHQGYVRMSCYGQLHYHYSGSRDSSVLTEPRHMNPALVNGKF